MLAVLILVLITINTVLTKPHGATGIAPGQRMPPFAVPLALGNLVGRRERRDATRTRAPLATSPRAPCAARSILNICQLYEHRPVVLALFVDGGSCTRILSDMQTLRPSFPGVRFAAVSIRGRSRRTAQARSRQAS